jgi:hypothetical protein
MAARKTTRRRTAAKAGGRFIGFDIELPPTLRAYASQVRKRLDLLERELTRAQVDVRRQAARMLREASHQLGKLEAEGEAGWRRLAAPYRSDLIALLRRLEKALAPPAARKRSARKAGARKAAGEPVD